MFNRLFSKPAAAIAAAVLIGAPAYSQDEPAATDVVARVGETEITLGHVLAARSELPDQYAQVPEKALFDGLVDQLVQKTLLMQMVEDKPDMLSRLFIENRRRDILYQQAARDFLGQQDITDEMLQAAYAENYTNQEPETEYNAAHILVETEEEAKEVVEKLANGGDFAELAKTLSTGPSGPSGGDLGWFGPGVMVPSFFDAVSALSPGDVSDPVQTQFGWHVIKLVETRSKDVPAFENVRESLLNELREESFLKLIEERTELTEVDRSGAEKIDPSVINKTDILEN